MERMDMQSRNQYLKVLKVLRERYLKAKAKKGKTQILDEYCRNSGQARKYVIRKIQPGVELMPKPRKKRKQTYDGQVAYHPGQVNCGSVGLTCCAVCGQGRSVLVY